MFDVRSWNCYWEISELCYLINNQIENKLEANHLRGAIFGEETVDVKSTMTLEKKFPPAVNRENW